MARTVRNAKLDTRSGRASLVVRREPYWTVISTGCAVGYRKGSKGGTWVARMRDQAGKQHYEALGAADDARDEDGLTVFSFPQAQAKAREFFKTRARELAGDYVPEDGPYTVRKAMEAYFAERERRGSKSVDKDRLAAELRILPPLGEIEISKLSTKRLRDWQLEMAKAPKLARAGEGAEREGKAIDAKDPEVVRARRATANRILTILRAALNHAFQEGRVSSDEAWRKVKPFREADAAVVRYLSDDEARRLVHTCEGAFRDLVRGALVTGCRYGELSWMRVCDFDAEAGTVTIRNSKSGKARHIALTEEGLASFLKLTFGRNDHNGRIFVRDDGEHWGPSHQQRPLEAASARAKIEPAATFHILRHTYASRLAMRGVPMGVIAAQLGHADTRMTEKHYAHLSPNYVADTVRAALPDLGIIEKTNLAALRRSGTGGRV